MSDLFRASVVALLLFPCATSFAAQVRGSVDASSPPAGPLSLGYTKIRVATHAPQRGSTRADIAVVLTAKESGVIPAPTEPYKVAITGLELKPNIAACVIDGKVAFTNDDRAPVTVLIEDQAIGTAQPGQTLFYDCKNADQKIRRLRVKEWPHIRGGLFVGEIGVAGATNANGAFSVSVPQGKYEVQAISEGGVIATKAVEVKGVDVDVGKLVARDGGELAPAINEPKEEAPVQPLKKEPHLPHVD